MRYYKHKVEGPKAKVFPLVCLHVGAKQSDEEFIKEHVERVKADPLATVVYMGDAGECNLKTSHGSVYEQTMPPGEQINYAAALLSPIREKILFGISGNHGRRLDKETGLSWDEMFCSRLSIPFLGVAAFVRLQVYKTHYDLYFHHGAGTAVNVGSKINKSLKFVDNVLADAVFTAHSHICTESPPIIRAFIDREPKVKYRTTHNYLCGCAYDARTGYAEQKGYAPILPAYLAVTFNGANTASGGNRSNCKEQSCQVWRVTP